MVTNKLTQTQAGIDISQVNTIVAYKSRNTIKPSSIFILPASPSLFSRFPKFFFVPLGLRETIFLPSQRAFTEKCDVF